MMDLSSLLVEEYNREKETTVRAIGVEKASTNMYSADKKIAAKSSTGQ